MLKIILFSFCLFFQLGAFAMNQRIFDDCMKSHLSTPTCTALPICARQAGASFQDYCKDIGHACCNNSNCGSGISDCSQNAPYKVPGAGAGPNSGPSLSCSGTPVNFRSVQDFITQKLAKYSSMSFLCVPAANGKVHCCVEVTRCSGKTDVYKVENLNGPVVDVKTQLASRTRGNCP